MADRDIKAKSHCITLANKNIMYSNIDSLLNKSSELETMARNVKPFNYWIDIGATEAKSKNSIIPFQEPELYLDIFWKFLLLLITLELKRVARYVYTSLDIMGVIIKIRQACPCRSGKGK